MTRADPPLIAPGDPALALSLLSRLPFSADPARAALATWAYPLAGLVIGALAGLAGLTVHWLGAPPAIAALVVIATSAALTGALHEDGLADCADGFWGGWTRAERLAIMKDSRTGVFGVIALFLALAARWSAVWLLFEAGPAQAVAAVMATAALSRGAMPSLMAALPHARETGLSHRVGRVPPRTAALAAGLGCAACLLLTGSLGAIFWTGLVVVVAGHVARVRIGGQTGDVLGATQQVAEITALAVIAS